MRRRFCTIAAKVNSSVAPVRPRSRKRSSFHDPFEVGEKHLHLLSFAARDEVLRCLGDASSHVAGSLMDAADDLPIRRVGAAFRFQRAGGAVGLAGAVNDGFAKF